MTALDNQKPNHRTSESRPRAPGPRSGPPSFRGGRTESLVGSRHHLCVNVGGVRIPGHRARRVEPSDRGLADWREPAHAARARCAQHGAVDAKARSGDSSQRSGLPIQSLAFGHRCGEFGVRPVMGTVGVAYDNAMAESFFASLEHELLARRCSLLSKPGPVGKFACGGVTRASSTCRRRDLKQKTQTSSSNGLPTAPHPSARRASTIAGPWITLRA